LGVIADERDAGIVVTQSSQNVQLEEIDVLKLIDQNVIECGAEFLTQYVVLNGVSPEEKKVIEVEKAERLFSRHVRAKEGRDVVAVFDAPRSDVIHHVAKWHPGIHGARIQGRESGFFGQASLTAEDSQIATD
jgi:hypothetical protein